MKKEQDSLQEENIQEGTEGQGEDTAVTQDATEKKETVENCHESEQTADKPKELRMTNDEIMKLIEDFEQSKKENEKLKDEFLRAKAEMENSKKRLTKHYEELSKHSTKQLLLDVVNMLDDFDRALSVGADNEQDNAGVLEGIQLIETQFIQTLENKWRLVRFDSKDEPFDPDKHEAMMREERDDIQEPVVVDEFSKGYLLDDRVIRPAKVKVATPK